VIGKGKDSITNLLIIVPITAVMYHNAMKKIVVLAETLPARVVLMLMQEFVLLSMDGSQVLGETTVNRFIIFG